VPTCVRLQAVWVRIAELSPGLLADPTAWEACRSRKRSLRFNLVFHNMLQTYWVRFVVLLCPARSQIWTCSALPLSGSPVRGLGLFRMTTLAAPCRPGGFVSQHSEFAVAPHPVGFDSHSSPRFQAHGGRRGPQVSARLSATGGPVEASLCRRAALPETTDYAKTRKVFDRDRFLVC